MANRVTASEVKEIIETSLTDTITTTFITTANRFIAEADLASNGVGSNALIEIERYLSAHFMSLRDQRVQQETFPTGVSFTYKGRTDMGLDATLYGQMARTMDTSGRLATFASGTKQARFNVISECDIDPSAS